MKHFATVTLSKFDFPWNSNMTFKINLDDAIKLNNSKSWKIVKDYLGEKVSDDIKSIQIESPLKNNLTYILILRPDKSPFSGIIGAHPFM